MTAADTKTRLRAGTDAPAILQSVEKIASGWAAQLDERQRRTSLDAADFLQLREAGVHLIGLPVELGGIWQGARRSTRAICEVLRTLAQGDPSVALVCVMHAAVLMPFLQTREAPEPYREAWEQQRQWAFKTVLDGAWWGTLNSEPGKANDRVPTEGRAVATGDGTYRLTGKKHFGSGSGITSFMRTAAIPEGESESDSFTLDVRGVPWDGSAGMRLTAEWDAHGMRATQSHAFEFSDFPAIRDACPRSHLAEGGAFFAVACAAVVVGVVETAIERARLEIGRRGPALVDYERVEWSTAEVEYWLIEQAYDGLVRAIEDPSRNRGPDVLRGKTGIANLAESALQRICRVIGARSYSRTSPYGFWYEDVRALGFLRPSWRVAYLDLFELGLRELRPSGA
jgi:alkylation response protein AidB-like acyl-CoA dehydrogenase